MGYASLSLQKMHLKAEQANKQQELTRNEYAREALHRSSSYQKRASSLFHNTELAKLKADYKGKRSSITDQYSVDSNGNQTSGTDGVDDRYGSIYQSPNGAGNMGVADYQANAQMTEDLQNAEMDYLLQEQQIEDQYATEQEEIQEEINRQETQLDLEKEQIETELQEINAQIESYTQAVSSEIKESAINFGA